VGGEWVVVVESGGGEGQNVCQCMKRALEATVVANSGKQAQTAATSGKQPQQAQPATTAQPQQATAVL